MGTVLVSNWLIGKYGVVTLPLVGLSAPAGVYTVGLAFGIRDALHEVGGARWVVAAIAAGAVLSYAISDAATIPGGLTTIAVASGVAFLASEFADLLVYAPLRERSWPLAVLASNAFGAVVDSALFLLLAFGSLRLIEGQVVGKCAMVLISLPLVHFARRARASRRTAVVE